MTTHNIPASDREVRSTDNALITSEKLEAEFGSWETQLLQLETKALGCPDTIKTDEDQIAWQDFLKDVDKFNKTIEGLREATKAPYLEATRTIDGFFKNWHNKDHKGNRSSMGRADVIIAQIAARIQAFMRFKAEQERMKREEEARRAREEEERKRREREAAERAEREAAEAARRAQEEADRLAASKRKKDREAAEAAQREADKIAREAEKRAAEQAALAAQEEAARQRAEDEAALARRNSASRARTRGDRSLSTLQDTWKFEIVDIDEVKGASLWPYIKLEHKEAALAAFMKANAPKEEPEGGWKPKGLDGVRFYKSADLRRR